MAKRALISGIFGQDGAYLSQFLLQQGYEVYGGFRRSSTLNSWRLEELGIADQIQMVPFDLLEFTNILRVVEEVRPDEFYNLAAQSFVGVSFEQPILTSDINALGTARVLEALRAVQPDCHFYQASTSEMFGKVTETPQSETTPLNTCSPYAASKLYAHWMTTNYRDAFGMHASSGILFNHESPLRGLEFVTRKITQSIARIRKGQSSVLELGNLASKRDWGFAGDYVRGMWMMLQQSHGDSYVLATGQVHSVYDFVDCAAEVAGFKLDWDGEGEKAKAIDRQTGKTIVRVNPKYFRPLEVGFLLGDASKARKALGWQPEVSFDALVEMMVRSDMDRLTSNSAAI